MGSLKVVKSFTPAASASSNIQKVQEIGALYLLTVVFGERGCKQIDHLKAKFWSPSSFAGKLPPPHYLITPAPAPSPATRVSPLVPVCEPISKMFCLQQNQPTSNHHTLPIYTFACAALVPKIPFSTLAFTLFRPVENNISFFWSPKMFCSSALDICPFLFT